ncbi:hypothetical protein BDZ91DRAFT_786879 [Kalaharituber pfeilii]|nr:hypothetical protein BDZ91DRAFT_786879 [Kalaharituber pfeilii]
MPLLVKLRLEAEKRSRYQSKSTGRYRWHGKQLLQSPNLIEVMSMINEHFSSMRSFLRAWTENDDPALRVSKQNFYNYGGGAEIIVEMWLGESKDEGIKGVDIGKIIKWILNIYEMEIDALQAEKELVLYHTRRKAKHGPILGGSMLASFNEMYKYLNKSFQ